MGHKKNKKLEKQKKEKQLWGEDSDDDSEEHHHSSSLSSSEKNINSNYYKLLHDDCRVMEQTILDHEPKQYCQKKKSSNEDDEQEATLAKQKKKKVKEESANGSSVASASSGASPSKKSKKKTMSNLDYVNILKESLTEDEKQEFFSTKQTTQHVLSPQNLQTSISEYSTYLNNVISNSNYSSNGDALSTAEKLTLELSKHYEAFKHSYDRGESLAAVVVLVSKISKLIFNREERNAFYLCKGLNLFCTLMSRMAPAMNDCEEYSQIVDELAFILYKFAEHAKARYVMLATGVFYSLWLVAQASKNSATIVHVNEAMELLGGAISMGFDLGNLLVHSNKHSPDVEFLKSTLSVYGEAEYVVDTSYGCFPDTFIGFSESYATSVSENDFNVSVHYAIVSSRSNFLSNNCFKWNPRTNVLSPNETGPGYYLLIDPEISWYAVLKFMQVIYSDKLSASYEESKTLRPKEESLKNFSLEQKLISEGFPKLLSTLYNEKTRTNATNCLESLGETNDESVVAMQSLFDDFDEQLLKDEMNFFFGKPVNYTYYYYFAMTTTPPPPTNTVTKPNTYTTDFLKRKTKIRQHAIVLNGIEDDLSTLFNNLVRTCFERDGIINEVAVDTFYPDIKITTDIEDLQEIDYILQEELENNPLFANVLECKGFYLHKSILSSRSEFFKKLLQYDGKSNEDSKAYPICHINNFSLSTLFIVFQFIYGGLREDMTMYTENLVEVFVASDLFLLYGLKKFCEQKICETITEENVEQLYAISIIYNSELIRDKCKVLMFQQNIVFSTNIKDFK
ncbi:hypothetical protein C9374_007201 [Naegleria lovaniensis]|uniref:BTB domain-containing protein n=1 Tax=Naegleria lovaniensis TaxID=51637 RepID=A0AA88KY35_NAELO|nr:uncharacterized protein C9374_007201 [Naegleria lovaniensis]KAG2393670.1 hypothetical protein C9374_007201 [Naegleria lovaniensis]